MTDIKQEIQAAVKDYKAAEKEVARTRKRLHKAVLKAQKSREITMIDVAQIWGVSPQALYKMLREMAEES